MHTMSFLIRPEGESTTHCTHPADRKKRPVNRVPPPTGSPRLQTCLAGVLLVLVVRIRLLERLGRDQMRTMSLLMSLKRFVAGFVLILLHANLVGSF